MNLPIKNNIEAISSHPIADLFPLMSDSEFFALKQDIAGNGLQEPIWIYQGMVLDGRNRYRACQEIGIDAPSREYLGADPVAFVVSLNLARRHLNESQRGMVAAKLANMRRGGDRPSANDSNFESANLPNGNVSQPQAAEMLNVSERTVRSAKKVIDYAIPEITQKVDSGEMSVSLGALVSRLPGEVQQEIASSKPEKVIEKAKAHVHVAQNSGENEWYTPPGIIESARLVMGSIDLDPASSDIANNTVGARHYLTKEDDGLGVEWFGNVWLNPPYSQPLMNKFAEKVTRLGFNQATVLVNNATETKWFQSIAALADAICFPSSRIKFLDPSGNASGQPLQGQAVLYFGENSLSFSIEFSKYGFVVKHV